MTVSANQQPQQLRVETNCLMGLESEKLLHSGSGFGGGCIQVWVRIIGGQNFGGFGGVFEKYETEKELGI